jgi:hypothetical protein
VVCFSERKGTCFSCAMRTLSVESSMFLLLFTKEKIARSLVVIS